MISWLIDRVMVGMTIRYSYITVTDRMANRPILDGSLYTYVGYVLENATGPYRS